MGSLGPVSEAVLAQDCCMDSSRDATHVPVSRLCEWCSGGWQCTACAPTWWSWPGMVMDCKLLEVGDSVHLWVCEVPSRRLCRRSEVVGVHARSPRWAGSFFRSECQVPGEASLTCAAPVVTLPLASFRSCASVVGEV